MLYREIRPSDADNHIDRGLHRTLADIKVRRVNKACGWSGLLARVSPAPSVKQSDADSPVATDYWLRKRGLKWLDSPISTLLAGQMDG